MRDRLPELGKANRIRITMDDGQVIEGVLSYADNARQEGSVYSKGNVLPDTVCVALGLNTDTAEPKDAFEMLAALAVSGGSSGSTPSHSANTLVNGSTTTATAVKIRYMAIEYGGER